MIEAAYSQDLLPVYTEDEAGPYQTIPYPGSHWYPASGVSRKTCEIGMAGVG